MEFLNEDLFKNFNFQRDEKNTESQIGNAELELGIKFPEGLRGILKQYNGGSGQIGKSYLDLWSLEDIVDFYQENMETDAYILVPFASDGCGMSFTLVKENTEIRIVPMDSLEYEYSKKCSNNFDEFINEVYSGNLVEY